MSRKHSKVKKRKSLFTDYNNIKEGHEFDFEHLYKIVKKAKKKRCRKVIIWNNHRKMGFEFLREVISKE